MPLHDVLLLELTEQMETPWISAHKHTHAARRSYSSALQPSRGAVCCETERQTRGTEDNKCLHSITYRDFQLSVTVGMTVVHFSK